MKKSYLGAFVEETVPDPEEGLRRNVVDEHSQEPVERKQGQVKVKLPEVWRNQRKFVVEKVKENALKIEQRKLEYMYLYVRVHVLQYSSPIKS